MWQRASSGGGHSLVVTDGAISDASGRVECGFEPKHILMTSQKYYNGSTKILVSCEGGASATQYAMYMDGSFYNRNIAAGQQITSIDSTGFNIGYPQYWNSANAYMIVTDAD